MRLLGQHSCRLVLAGLLMLASAGAACAGNHVDVPSVHAKRVDAQQREQGVWRGKWVTFIERDGLAVAEGDMILGPADALRAAAAPKAARKDSVSMALAYPLASLWPRSPSGVVNPNIVGNFNVIAEPFSLISVTRLVASGPNGETLFEAKGSGFTGKIIVVIDERDYPVQLIDSRTARVAAPAGSIAANARLDAYAYQPLTPGCAVSTDIKRVYVTTSSAAADYIDMWWAGESENGWGASITQHGMTQFIVLYVYDNAGKPIWYAMPGGTWSNNQTTYSGALYQPTSAPFSAYDPSQFKPGGSTNASVGSATLTYTGNASPNISYTINGISGSKTLTRQLFDSGSKLPLAVNDLWWNPSENSWGLNIAQQGPTLFPIWYTYDAAGNDVWYAVSGGTWTGNSFAGDLYSAASSSWLGATYNPATFRATKIGSMTLNFSDANSATMTYTVNGLTQSKSIIRQVF